MKFKGKLMLILGVMAAVGLLAQGNFLDKFEGENLISAITTVTILAGLIIGGIILIILGRKE